MKIMNEYGHPDNICNTPTVATIELHHNKYGTGEYFLTFITHAGLPNDGYWEYGLLSMDEVVTIMSILKRSKHRLNIAFRKEENKEQDDAVKSVEKLRHGEQKPESCVSDM